MKPSLIIQWSLAGFLFVALTLSGCQRAYYAAWETLGKEKRHLLRDAVEKTRQDQKAASEKFKDVLSRIQQMYGFEGGRLEKFYHKLHSEYEACKERAEAVKERIESVEDIAEDLFAEWEKESNQISNPELRSQSRQSLWQTRQRYERLHVALEQSESRMEPVLTNLNDYVLFLKHNLNARAVGALRQEMGDITVEVTALIADIERSVQEADRFLKSF